MPTINISLPEPMRLFIEEQSALENFTTSEYIRHLIREEQEEKEKKQLSLLRDYLAISARQLDEGVYGKMSFDEIIKEGKKKFKSSKGS